VLSDLTYAANQVRKSQRAKRAKRFQPDYELLNETVVILDKLAGTAAQKTDLTKLSELLSRIKQAERRFPELPLGAVVAHIDTYRKATLPDDFRRKLSGKRVLLDDLLDLSRQQGAAIAGALAAIGAVQNEIEAVRADHERRAHLPSEIPGVLLQLVGDLLSGLVAVVDLDEQQRHSVHRRRDDNARLGAALAGTAKGILLRVFARARSRLVVQVSGPQSQHEDVGTAVAEPRPLPPGACRVKR
jgi:hypothetical protein